MLLLILLSLSFSSAVVTDWTCTPSPASLTPPAFPTGVTFQQLVCNSSAIPIFGKAGPLNVSVLSVDLSLPSLRLLPITNSSLAGIDQMAASRPSLLGGVNGGYFWRIDVRTFTDGVCLGKSRANALSPPSSATPNTGVGDGSIVASGALLSSNCDCIGFSRPAILTLNGTASRIDVLHRGDQPPAGLALDSLSAGPNLVSSNASGSYIDIPSDDDNIGACAKCCGPATPPSACAAPLLLSPPLLHPLSPPRQHPRAQRKHCHWPARQWHSHPCHHRRL